MKQRNRGQVLVLFVLSLVVLIGMAALGIDVGYMYSVRHDLQRCADTGALAGASRFINGPGETGTWADGAVRAEATARAIDFATRDNVVQTTLDPSNGNDNVIVTFPSENRIKVQTERTVPLFFARLFLGPTKRITAYAVAEAATSSAHVKCPAPFGVPIPWIENGGDPLKYDPGIDCVVSLDDPFYANTPPGEDPCDYNGIGAATGYAYSLAGGSIPHHDNTGLRSARDHYLCKGTLLKLKIGEPGATQEPGHFYALDLSNQIVPGSCPEGVTPNPGASFYKYMVMNKACEDGNGCQTDINLGGDLPPLDIKPGNMVGPTVQAVAPTYYKDIGFIGQIPEPESLMNGGSTESPHPNYNDVNYQDPNADWNMDLAFNKPLARVTPYRYIEAPVYDPSQPPDPGKSIIQPVRFVGFWIQDISENQGTIVARIVELKSSGTSESDPGGGALSTKVIRLVE